MSKRLVFVFVIFALLFSAYSFAATQAEVYVRVDVDQTHAYRVSETYHVFINEPQRVRTHEIDRYYHGYLHEIDQIWVLDPVTSKPISFTLEEMERSYKVHVDDGKYYHGLRSYELRYRIRAKSTEDIFFARSLTEDELIRRYELNLSFQRDIENIDFLSDHPIQVNKSALALEAKNVEPDELLVLEAKLPKGFFSETTRYALGSPFVFGIASGCIVLLSCLWSRHVQRRSGLLRYQMHPPQDMDVIEAYMLLHGGHMPPDSHVLLERWKRLGYIRSVGDKAYRNLVDSMSIEPGWERRLYLRLFPGSSRRILSLGSFDREYEQMKGEIKREKLQGRDFFERVFGVRELVLTAICLVVILGVFSPALRIVMGLYAWKVALGLLVYLMLLQVFCLRPTQERLIAHLVLPYFIFLVYWLLSQRALRWDAQVLFLLFTIAMSMYGLSTFFTKVRMSAWAYERSRDLLGFYQMNEGGYEDFESVFRHQNDLTL